MPSRQRMFQLLLASLSGLTLALFLSPVPQANAHSGHGADYTIQAIQAYEALLAQNPDDSELHFNLGTLYETQSDFAKAEQRFLDALRLQADLQAAQYHLAKVYFLTERVDKAIEALKAIDDPTLTTEAAIALGNIYLTLKKFDEALEQYKIAIEKDPENPAAYFSMGLLDSEMGKEDDAIRNFKLALSFDPTNMDAINRLIELYDKSKRFQEKIDLLQSLLDQTPEGTPLAVGLAQEIENTRRLIKRAAQAGAGG